MENLINKINIFDNWYMMSDDSKVYNKWSNIESEINTEISNLSTSELIELKSSITNEASLRTFSNHFENLPAKPVENEETFNAIMESAAYYFANGIITDWKEAIIAACRAYKLAQSLIEGIASFTYIKKDGSTRQAVGTLNKSYFTYESKGVPKKSNPSIISYWDLDRNAFRCMKIETLIQVNNIISQGVAA